MPKLPFLKFYGNDWIADTRILSASARGVWIDIIWFLWNAPHRGSLSHTLFQWSQICSIPQDQVLSAFAELQRSGVAEIQPRHFTVTKTSRVTASDDQNDAIVTVECRRILRWEKANISHALRQTRYRQRKRSDARVTEQNQKSDGEKLEARSYSSIEVASTVPIKLQNTSNHIVQPSPNGSCVDFEVFWAEYPRKEARRPAELLWNKLHVDSAMWAVMHNWLEAAKRSDQWLDGKNHIPHPRTWLHQRRWESDPPPSKTDARADFWKAIFDEQWEDL